MKKYNPTSKIFAAFIIALLLCEVTGAGIHRHDVSSEKFIALANQPLFECVGQLKKGGENAGSAVMIASRWAVTSAHIFGDSSATSVTLEIGGRAFQIIQVIIHPEYKSANPKAVTDLALVRINEVYKGKTARLYAKDKEVGAIVTIVGYGRFRGALDAKAETEGKRAGQNVIDTLGGENLPDNFLGIDLTDPKSRTTDKFGNRTPLELEYIIDGGDSGGGMFLQAKKGEWLLAGINTRTIHDREKLLKFSEYGFYGSRSFFTRLSDYKDWIDSTIKGESSFKRE